jgi:hypothetical protein
MFKEDPGSANQVFRAGWIRLLASSSSSRFPGPIQTACRCPRSLMSGGSWARAWHANPGRREEASRVFRSWGLAAARPGRGEQGPWQGKSVS